MNENADKKCQDFNGAQDALADAISRHLCFHELRCLLWWAGGFWTLFTIWLLLVEATTKTLTPESVFSFSDSGVYAVGLYFLLGMRWVKKKANEDNGGKNGSNFYGEFWLVLWLIAWSMIKFSLSPRGFNALFLFGFGSVYRMPDQFLVTFGFAAGALGIFRGKEVMEIIQTGLLSVFRK